VIARTVRHDGDVDLLAEAGDDGVLFETADGGLAGRGVALRIPLPTGPGRLAVAAELVAEALAAIDVEDEVGLPGCGPVAFAALPFDESTPGEVVVPATVVGSAADGTRWTTVIDGRFEPVGTVADGPGPSSFTVTSTRPPADWCRAVAAGRDLVAAGELVKVVLAREVVVEADAPIRPTAVVGALRAAYPASYRFSIDGFVGATPELLVQRTGDLVRSHPMAGTAPRRGDPTADARVAAALLASAKDQVEHRITIDTVLDLLLPFCSYVDAEAEPSIVAMANVQHLASLVTGRLSSPPADALTLAAALHPTPAVGGSPRKEALAAIAELEGLDRGRWAGPVGWVDGRGNGTFAVGIRSAELDGRRARLLAGVGVVADSDPAAELAETRAKLQALLTALVRP
jgi:menaquinone-specific isochorismate synthase